MSSVNAVCRQTSDSNPSAIEKVPSKLTASEVSSDTDSISNFSSELEQDRKLSFLPKLLLRVKNDPKKSKSSNSPQKPSGEIIVFPMVINVEATKLSNHGSAEKLHQIPSGITETLPAEQVRGSECVIEPPNTNISLQRLEKFRKERDFWKSSVIKANVHYGPKSLKTAEALMCLGQAQISCQVSMWSIYTIENVGCQPASHNL